jgi:hypothetical protein
MRTTRSVGQLEGRGHVTLVLLLGMNQNSLE